MRTHPDIGLMAARNHACGRLLLHVTCFCLFTCLQKIATQGAIYRTLLVNICFYCRKLLETIDQSEFEGFEYVNPLLTSAEEAV